MEKKTPGMRILAENQADEALAFLSRSGRAYGPDDIENLQAGFTSGNWTFVMAQSEGEDIGCFYLNRRPRYHVYRALNVPELQDLRVLPGFRRQGIGRALVEYAEDLVRDEGGAGLGIAVALTADLGPAQRLYASMGYAPDGNGISVDREPAQRGQRLILDDDVCLMLLKLF